MFMLRHICDSSLKKLKLTAHSVTKRRARVLCLAASEHRDIVVDCGEGFVVAVDL